jgi:hypothetical protein
MKEKERQSINTQRLNYPQLLDTQGSTLELTFKFISAFVSGGNSMSLIY